MPHLSRAVPALAGAVGAFVLAAATAFTAGPALAHDTSPTPSPTSASTNNETGMDGMADMPGMDHSTMDPSQMADMPGMDHSTMDPSEMADMPGMDHSTMDPSEMADMPGMDHSTTGRAADGHDHGGSTADATDGTDGMDGMDGMDHAPGTGVSRPRGLVLGGFGVVNGAALVAAAVLRRRTAGERDRRRAARAAALAMD